MKVFKKVMFYIFTMIMVFIMLKFFVFYLPFLIGFAIAELLEPTIDYLMDKTKIARKTSSIIVIFAFFIILILLLFLGGVFVISEATNLLSNFNDYLSQTTEFINSTTNYINLDKLNVNSEIKNAFENTTLDFVNNFAKTLKNTLSGLVTGITSLPKVFIYIIITILATYFIASDKFYILDQMEYHFPKNWVNKIRKNAKEICASLGGYIKAELVMILISFIVVLVRIKYFLFSWT